MTNVSPRFEQLQGLIGREAEVQLLQDAYQRVFTSTTTPSCEAVLVHGYSGTGKTSLVRQTFFCQVEDGTMISGKFDIIHSGKPYSAVVDALTQLCQATTWNKISNSQELQLELQQRLSISDMKILSRLVPAFEDRLETSLMTSFEDDGSQSTATNHDHHASIDNTFAFIRFAEVVRSFLYLVAKFLPSPLILFLDDIQAADPESMSLISSLTSPHSESRNLLLIFAYRDHVDPEQQFKQSTILTSTTVFKVTDIKIGNLDMEQMNILICKLLRSDPEDALPLSRLIIERTGGNVYVGLQFLEMLKNEQLLRYSFETCRWVWNLDQIRADTDVTDNVVQLLTSKIEQLSPDVQSALQLAAFLGFYFDIEFLERIAMQEWAVGMSTRHTTIADTLEGSSSKVTVSESLGTVMPSEDDTDSSNSFTRAIAVAVEENLIDRAEGTKYKFTHDRVLQAVYDMVPAGRRRDMLHWRIGELLWKELQEEQQQKQQQHDHNQPEMLDDWKLFAAADQFQRGFDCNSMTSTDGGITPLAVAHLNLLAGKAAFEKSAFKHAAGYFDRGVKLMNGRWQSEYSLCLELHTLSAEAEYVANNFEKCDERVDEILINGRCLEDKLRAYLVKVQSQGVRGLIVNAMYESVAVLRVLGARIPLRPNLLHLLLELAKTKRLMKGTNISDLESLPNMTRPFDIWACRFLQYVVIFSCFGAKNEFLLVATCRMMQLMLKHGVSSQGPFALASYGLIMGFLGHLDTAYEAGRVAVELSKRPHTISSYACTVGSVYAFSYHLKHPIIRCLDYFMDGYNTGVKSGDIEGAAICLGAYTTLGLVVGKKLDVVVSEMEGFRQAYRDEFERNFAMMCLTPFHQFALNLMGQSENPQQLRGGILDDESYLIKVQRAGNEIGKVALFVTRIMLLYIFGDVDGASKALAQVNFALIFKGTHLSTPFFYFYAGLVMLGMARKTRKRKYLRRANMFKRAMAKFVKAGNLNMPPLLQLVSAEQTSLRPRCRPEDVKKAYESALRVAAQSGFSVVEAIGYERAGEYMQSIGDGFWAETYLSRALLLYDEWGATAKTRQMISQYAFLAESDRPSGGNVGLSLRKRYNHKESDERRRMSLAM